MKLRVLSFLPEFLDAAVNGDFNVDGHSVNRSIALLAEIAYGYSARVPNEVNSRSCGSGVESV